MAEGAGSTTTWGGGGGGSSNQGDRAEGLEVGGRVRVSGGHVDVT